MEAVNAKKPFVAFPINSCSIILPSQPREQLHNYQGTKKSINMLLLASRSFSFSLCYSFIFSVFSCMLLGNMKWEGNDGNSWRRGCDILLKPLVWKLYFWIPDWTGN